MSTRITSEGKLKKYLAKYLTRACTIRKDVKLSLGDVMKAYDLAVQQMRLTTLEEEIFREKSKIDFSTDECACDKCKKMVSLLEKLACWEDDAVPIGGSYAHFDEPNSVRLCRELLKELNYTTVK